MMVDGKAVYDQIKARAEVTEASMTSARRITATVSAENYRPFVEFLVKLGFDHVIMITGLDNGKELEVLLHLGRSVVVTVRTVLNMDKPVLDSLVDILPGIPFHEREVHDVLGVDYRNSPDQSRVILPYDWPSGVYPLRKSFSPKTPEPLRRG